MRSVHMAAQGAAILGLLALVGLLAGCDILRGPALAVEAWGPGEGYRGFMDLAEVWLDLGPSVDRGSVEGALDLSRDGSTMDYSLVWEGRRVRIIPLEGLARGHEYRVRLGKDARTPDGMSLAEDFEGRFWTRDPGEGPRIIAWGPGESLSQGREAVWVDFSSPMDVAVLRSSASLSPAVAGQWFYDEALRRARFVPREAWTPGEAYRLRWGPDLADAQGRTLGSEWVRRFGLDGGLGAPSLVALEVLDKTGEMVGTLARDRSQELGLPGRVTNEGISTRLSLRLRFDQEVSRADLSSRLQGSGGPGIEVAPGPSWAMEFGITLPDAPAFGTLWTLDIRGGIKNRDGVAWDEGGAAGYRYRLLHDSPSSQPSRLVGVRLARNPGGADLAVQDLGAWGLADAYGNLGLDSVKVVPNTPYTATIELVFSLAPGASVDLFSLREKFRVSATNGALSFSPRKVAEGLYPGAPVQTGWETYKAVTVQGIFTNQVDSGLVSFIVGAGLRDSLGNEAAEAQSLVLHK